jgi:uncharacterized tellurite resistance protein B-like protein
VLSFFDDLMKQGYKLHEINDMDLIQYAKVMQFEANEQKKQAAQERKKIEQENRKRLIAYLG